MLGLMTLELEQMLVLTLVLRTARSLRTEMEVEGISRAVGK